MDCMTLNNNFCENDRFLAKEKTNKTQRNFGFSDLEKKISSTFLHEIFLKKNSFKKFQKLFLNNKTFFKKIQGKILKEGFQNFPRTHSKKNAPFPKVFSKKSSKVYPKISKNPPQKSSKSLPPNHKRVSSFHNTNHHFIDEDFENIFK